VFVHETYTTGEEGDGGSCIEAEKDSLLLRWGGVKKYGKKKKIKLQCGHLE